MKMKKIAVFIGTAVLTMSLFTGCSKEESNNTQTATMEESTTNESVNGEVGVKDGTIIVQVTGVDGNTITGDIGIFARRQRGEKPESGEMPKGGQKPESGKMPKGGQKPEGGEMPKDGQKPDGGGMPGDGFQASGESMTFVIEDTASITVEFMQSSQEGSLEDIAVGSVLEVTMDDNDVVTSVIIKNLTPNNGFGGGEEVTNGTAAEMISQNAAIEGETYTSEENDENALRIDGVDVTLEEVAVIKSGGQSSNTENGDFYGQNAGLLALNGATVTITNATVTTNAVNGNGIFSYGEGTTVNISNTTIQTSQNNSGGIQTTGGGTMNASKLTIETQGNSSAAIRSDRGGGTVIVDGGTYVTNGTGSPAVYCTADIQVSNALLTANASEGVVVEGKNSVALKDCEVVADMKNTYHGDETENIHAIMIYQSMSGDASIGEATFSAEGGSITAKTGDMFYITNTDCQMALTNVAFTLANDIFLRVEGNSSKRGWGMQGANGGDVVLHAANQKIEGNILVDSISSLDFTLEEGSSFDGAVNSESEGGTVNVTLSEDSVWNLTGDSYITSLTGSTGNVNLNGFHLYVNGEEVE